MLVRTVKYDGSVTFDGMHVTMKRFMPLLLNVWREACRHIDIGVFTASITPLLGERLPIDLVLVRSIDLRRNCVETVGTGVFRTGVPPAHARTPCSPQQLERLLAWCRRGQVVHLLRDGQTEERQLLVPEGLSDEALVGPLCSDRGPVGLAVLAASSTESFTKLHQEVAAELLDPLTVAFENDRRQRELVAHQQAAEADRQSLLTRLGRQDISEAVVGVESGLKEVMERVELVSRSDVPVLLFGETGSGKEVIARAIHTRSSRVSGPFHRVNCGAIPPELIDSELFGHERGSFTGAIGMRKGWFERADGGTLFLDEVGELPLAAQVRLLRILQDGTFERVGGQQQLSADVRVVAATNRDLQRMVAEGRFRDDLWYRLAVFPIQLPALRDRPEDMPALAAHFALRAARRFGLPIQMPTSDDLNLLLLYDWPGNIRELASVLNRAAILGNGKGLQVARALGITPPLPVGSNAGAPAPATLSKTPGVFPGLDQVISEHIKAALRTTRGRIEGPQGTAGLLGINPHTLRARMRKLGIEWKTYRA